VASKSSSAEKQRLPVGTPAPAGAPGAVAPAVRVPTVEDLDLAKNDALLQLRIGRSAHYYTILVAAAFLLDDVLVLYLNPTLVNIGSPNLRSEFFLLFPLIGSLFLAVFGLRVKWETYQLWPWETHFWVSIGAVAYNGAIGYVYFANLFHSGPPANWTLLPWFYPAVLLGLTLALVGLALTWSEWTERKSISVVAAVLPVPVAFLLVIFQSTNQAAVSALALSLSTSAVLYLISGGFLHIISSGTRTHEREVITSGQSRMFQLAEEVRRREEAHRFREATLLKREADAEDAEASLRRHREAMDQAKAQIDALELDLRQRTQSLRAAEQTWVARAAETNTQGQIIADKEANLVLREQELQARLPKLAEREIQLNQRESDHHRREVEVLRREQELERRKQGIPEAEANLERRRQELDRRTTELLQRESELRSRAGATPGTPPTASAVGAERIEDREARLAQLKMTLDEQNLILGRQARSNDEALKDLLRREQEIARREEGVTSREAALTQRETDAADRFDLGEERRRQYEEAVKTYEEKIRVADRREAELAARTGELERLGAGLKQRDEQTKERDRQLGLQRTTLDRLQRVLAERLKTLDAREDEVALRAQSLARSPHEGTGPGGPPAPLATAPPTVPDLLSAPTPRRLPDRAPTGTPRLDDLLQGGLPPKGHVLLVGDAFVGKEVVLYAFLTEGLKRGESAVIVTTARSPEEVGQQIGLVAPQFREYEQMGRVIWIDASQTTLVPGKPVAGAVNAAVLRGPEDHAGILSALVAAAKKVEASGAPKLRVGFLGVAATVSHVEERAASVFLQNFVGILKPRNALAMYSLEAGAIAEAQVERLLARMDGAIRFRQEGDKTYLSVAGLGEVQTREWIECRATNRALVLGSFSLERIR
jgi:KaiC/GvpD/RAD55 family RecA-like ATPase